MKKIFLLFPLLFAFAGCCAYSELYYPKEDTLVNGKKPLATYHVANTSYSLFGLLPISSGRTWKEGPLSEHPGGISFFSSNCSLDDNLESVKHACNVVGSDNICNLVGRVDSSRAWSLFLIKRETIKTSCVILEK